MQQNYDVLLFFAFNKVVCELSVSIFKLVYARFINMSLIFILGFQILLLTQRVNSH